MLMGKEGSWLRWLLLFSLLTALLAAVQAQPLAQQADAQAMISLRWDLHMKDRLWPKKSDPCSNWTGVSCNIEGHVVGISLSGLVRNAVGQANPSFALDALRRLPYLQSLNASRFTLKGTIPDWFGELQSLFLVDLSSASVNGTIPESFGNLKNVTVLSLADNNLTGPIPSSLGNLLRMTSVNLSFNGLSGEVPTTLQNANSLSTLDLSWNRLEGSIPTAITRLPFLQNLLLAGNLFNRSIPKEIGDLADLVALDLSSNSFFGPCPSEVGNLTSLQSLNLSRNLLVGPIPEQISSCRNLQTLILGHNLFNGSFPELGTLSNLTVIDISNNNLTGTLPDNFSNLAQIESILLPNNSLYGSLPASLLSLQNLTLLDVSSNFFSGEVPGNSITLLSSAENCLKGVNAQRPFDVCESFYAQQGLPYDTPILVPPEVISDPRQGSVTKSRNKHLPAIFIGVAAGLGSIAIVITLLLLYFRYERKQTATREVDPVVDRGQGALSRAVAVLTKGETFSYGELQRATNHFSAANLIRNGHSGDLYKGFLDEGAPIVVKRVDFRKNKREGLVAELELFRKASHTRLIPLIGHCLEREDEKLLVYKFMLNGDLDYALHRKGSPSLTGDMVQSLDWITRLKIALGAAEGLAYLHHECSPAFVHRDVKSSSILLDDKFEVRLGSLSEACPHQRESHSRRITQLFRLSQSIKPGDPGTPVASCSYDVYCFGKVLLELVSGKIGISNSEEGTDAWLERALPLINPDDKDSIQKLLDPSLNVEEDLLEEVWAMGIIAKSCLHPRPSKRPNMRHIHKALENPLRVVREDNGSARIRASPRSSRSAIFFESWRHSSSETVILPGTLRDEYSVEMNPRYTTGTSASQGSQGDNPQKRTGSSEIFPEPVDERIRYK